MDRLLTPNEAQLIALVSTRERPAWELIGAIDGLEPNLPNFSNLTRRLALMGLITSTYTRGDSGRGTKKLWIATDEGRAALQETIDFYKNLERLAS